MNTTPTPPNSDAARAKRSYDWVSLAMVTMVMFTLFIGTIFMLGFVYKDRMVGSTVNLAVHSFLTDTPLPQQQKKDIIYQTDRIYTAFLDKKIKLDELTQFIKQLLKGPTFPAGAVYFALDDYIDASDLTEAQKTDGKLQVGRMVRACVAGKFKADSLQPVVDLIRTPTDPEHPQKTADTLLKKTLTPEELNQAITLCRKLADDANEPNEPFIYDPSDHVRQIVDKMIGPERARVLEQ